MPDELRHPLGWVHFTVSAEQEAEARAMRAERDRRYRNIFRERTTDERWVGELGEMVVDHWLKASGVRAEWITTEAAGRPDFILDNGTKIGVKTVKRQVAPQARYTAQVTGRHADEDVDHFVFLTYEMPARRLWLLGGIARGAFKRQARYYGAGEWVHPDYQIAPGHEIYNIAIDLLTAPGPWLTSVARYAKP